MDVNIPYINLPVVYPLIVLTVVGLAMLMIDAFLPKVKRDSFVILSGLGMVLASVTMIIVGIRQGSDPMHFLSKSFGGMFIFDRLTILSTLVIFGTGIFTVLLSRDYLNHIKIQENEYFSLIVFAALSMACLCASNDLIVLFVSFEMLSLSLYVLVGINRRSMESQEGALKYFLLGSIASAFLLLGIAYLWGATGTTNLSEIESLLVVPMKTSGHRWMFIATSLIIVGFGFKLALVPFHQWAPEAYKGAPTPITAYLATGSKAAGFVALFHVLAAISPWTYTADFIVGLLFSLSVLTALTGNVLAIVQTDIKRMLAYSSVAHSGYMLIAAVVYAATLRGPAEMRPLADRALDAILFYIFAYSILNLIAFGVVSALAPKGEVKIDNLSGLVGRHPWLAGAMAVAMFGLAGIPFTIGFQGKLLLFFSAVEAGYAVLAVLIALASVISAFYYLRVVVVMTMKPEAESKPLALAKYSWASLFVIAFSAAASFVFFMFPESFLHLFS